MLIMKTKFLLELVSIPRPLILLLLLLLLLLLIIIIIIIIIYNDNNNNDNNDNKNNNNGNNDNSFYSHVRTCQLKIIGSARLNYYYRRITNLQLVSHNYIYSLYV